MSEHTVASGLHWDNADRPFVPGPSLHDAASEAIAESYDEFDNRFRIRVADKAGWRSRASSLIERRYAWRGYSASPLEGHTSGQVTLCACVDDATVATITAALDSQDGLYVSRLYPDAVAQLQAQGRKLCEFTKLAVDEACTNIIKHAGGFILGSPPKACSLGLVGRKGRDYFGRRGFDALTGLVRNVPALAAFSRSASGAVPHRKNESRDARS